MKNEDTSELEISLLLEAIYQKYGYDFRQYSKAHIHRRIMNRLRRYFSNSIKSSEG
jgi:chemotaxis protein methyltransferase CheR